MAKIIQTIQIWTKISYLVAFFFPPEMISVWFWVEAKKRVSWWQLNSNSCWERLKPTHHRSSREYDSQAILLYRHNNSRCRFLPLKRNGGKSKLLWHLDLLISVTSVVLCTESESEGKSGGLPMKRDGAIRLMLAEAWEGDEGSNWFISVCSGGVVGFFDAKRYEELRPWLVFLTPVDKCNQKKSLGVSCLMGKIAAETWKKVLI